jgi:hypothetical protein
VEKATQQQSARSRGRAARTLLDTLQVMLLLGRQLVGQRIQTALYPLYIAQHVDDLLTVPSDGAGFVARVEQFLVRLSASLTSLNYL